MPATLPDSSRSKSPRQHEPGAFAAWGLMAGAILGAVVGALFHHAILAGLGAGTIGWIIGAILDRSRA